MKKNNHLYITLIILVSVLNKEYPLFTYTSRIVSLADNKNFSIYTSPVCLAIAFYFAEKKSGTAIAKKKVELLSSKISITNVGQEEVMKSIRNKMINDFEDGIEYYAARLNKCSVIVTEDIQDFYFSEIDVKKAEDFLNSII